VKSNAFTPPIKKYLLRFAGTLLSLFLLIYLFEKQGWNEILVVINQIPAWQFGVVLILMLVSRMAVTLRWHSLLRSAGLKIQFRDTLRLTFGGLFASNFLPTTIGGDVFRLAGAIQLQLDSAICTASLIADRLIGMIGMALVFPLSLPVLVNLWHTIINTPFNNLLTQGMVAIDHTGLRKLVQRLQQYGKNTLTTLQYWINHPLSLMYALFFSILHMACLFSIISILLNGMQDPMPFWLIAGLWSVVYFITQIPISINGYGLQEIALTLIFAHGGGISPQSSMSIALLMRALIMITSLPGVFFLPGIISGEKTI